MLRQKYQEVKNLVIIKKHIVDKGDKINMNSFQNINFFDIFEAMDDDYLEDIAIKNPKQLKRMCVFLTLDHQIRQEGVTKSGDKIITD